MKKKLRVAGIAMLAVFVVIQFVRPEKNMEAKTPEHLYEQALVSVQIQTMLNSACMDCHSGQTRYAWYHRIAPVSWVVSHHVNEGKHELNFSQWGKLDTLERIGALDAISQELEKGKMPLKSYTLIHRDAVLSVAQLDSLKRWISTYQGELLSAMQ